LGVARSSEAGGDAAEGARRARGGERKLATEAEEGGERRGWRPGEWREGGREGGEERRICAASEAQAPCPPCARCCSSATKRSCWMKSSLGERDETCPVSTEGWTRRVHVVREGGGGGGWIKSSLRRAAPRRARESSAVRSRGSAER